MSQFHTLTVKSIVRQTDKAVSITFDVPKSLEYQFAFKAGQYVTLKAVINGMVIRRDYSLSSSPKSGNLTVTIKEIDKGVFSTYANKTLQSGESLGVSVPNGRFTYTPQSNVGCVVAFAAGSGITPIMSIARTVLETDNGSDFVLVYGNKNPEKTIFQKEIMELQALHLERFKIQFVYSESDEEGALFGRIDEGVVNSVLKDNVDLDQSQLFYLCGPEGMIKTASAVLSDNGVQDARVLFELFTAPSVAPISSVTISDGQAEITILVDDEETTLMMPQNQTILEAALENDIDAPGRSKKKALTKGGVFYALRPTTERYADVFRSLGFSLSLENISFPPPKQYPFSILKALDGLSAPVIGIAPFAAHMSKTYSKSNMEKVIYELQKEYKILLFGGGTEEIEKLQELALSSLNVFSVAGKFTLGEELDIISNLNVMLSMDSSNGHLAAMLGIKVVTLWGVTHPFAGFAPFNQEPINNLLADRIEYPRIPTSIYGNIFPKGYELAIETIHPEVVVQAVKNSL